MNSPQGSEHLDKNTPATPDAAWAGLEATLRHRMTPRLYESWLKPLQPLTLEKGELVLQAPSAFMRSWVADKYLSDIQEALEDLLSGPAKVSLVVNEKLQTAPAQTSLFTPQGEAAAPPVPRAAPQILSPKGLPVSPSLTFETFVEGSSNRLAFTAAQAVAERPSQAYNPFIIYGETGLGKTHLLQAIANEIMKNHPGLTYTYISAEKFMNEFTRSLQLKTMNDFRKIFRSVDVLLIDDVQFLDDPKVGTQNEFFYTFHDLYHNNKQIVATSDVHPTQSQLNNRLKSRFEMGLVVEIMPPDLETRIAILHQKAASRGIPLPNDVGIYIANKINSNIRSLEGALNRVYFQAQNLGGNISMELAEQALRHLAPATPVPLTLDRIKEETASHFGITIGQLLSSTRQRHVSYPRQVAMYLCRKLTSASLPEIGEAFAGKDHTTVLYSLRKLESQLPSDPSLQNHIDSISRKFSI